MPDAVEVAQHLRVGVGDAGHRAGVAVLADRQLPGAAVSGTRPSAAGIGSPCGSRVGIAELGVDAVQHPVGDRVLEHLGLVVHFVPAVAEFAHQERLHQPVPAHHRQRGASARVGQRHRAVLLVVDQALIGELADGFRRRAGRHPDALGEHLGADLLERPLLGGPDDLQVVLGDRRQVAGVAVGAHRTHEKFRQSSPDLGI